jgi:hypothetical protein
MEYAFYREGVNGSFGPMSKSLFPQHSDLPAGLAQPAQRALLGAGCTSLAQVAALGEARVKRLHGIGPNALDLLRRALTAQGLSFDTEEHKPGG